MSKNMTEILSEFYGKVFLKQIDIDRVRKIYKSALPTSAIDAVCYARERMAMEPQSSEEKMKFTRYVSRFLISSEFNKYLSSNSLYDFEPLARFLKDINCENVYVFQGKGNCKDINTEELVSWNEIGSRKTKALIIIPEDVSEVQVVKDTFIIVEKDRATKATFTFQPRQHRCIPFLPAKTIINEICVIQKNNQSVVIYGSNSDMEDLTITTEQESVNPTYYYMLTSARVYPHLSDTKEMLSYKHAFEGVSENEKATYFNMLYALPNMYKYYLKMYYSSNYPLKDYFISYLINSTGYKESELNPEEKEYVDTFQEQDLATRTTSVDVPSQAQEKMHSKELSNLLLFKMRTLGITLSESQEEQLSKCTNIDISKLFADKKQARIKRQEEIKKQVAIHNAKKEEWLNSEENPSNMRTQELANMKRELLMLNYAKSYSEDFLTSGQSQAIEEINEFFAMKSLADSTPHEPDTGMAPEVRTWYQNHYQKVKK